MNLIRHDSRIRLAWGIALIPLNLCFAVVLSYRLLWDYRVHDFLYWSVIGFMWVDLFLDFTTTVKKNLRVLDEWKEVVGHYSRRWFVVDFLAAMPFEYIADWTQSEHWILWLLRISPLLKTFKVFTVLRDLQSHLQLNPAIMRLMSFGYWFAQIVHAMSIFWVVVGGSPLEMETSPATSKWVMREGAWEEIKTEAEKKVFTHFEVYLRALYWTVTTVGTVGYGDYSPAKDNNVQIVYTIIVEILGVSMYGYIVGNVSGLIANLDSAKAAFTKRTEEVNEFMRSKQLPQEIQARVRDYYHYLWEKRRNVSDEDVLRELPSSLAADVLIHLNREILRKVEFFQNASDLFVREVVKMLEPQVFLPGDAMIRQGERGDCMYFLSSGTAEVQVDGTVIAQLGAGSPFGEMALVSGEKRTASVCALDYCDVYMLRREAFEQLRARHTDFDQRVRAIVALRSRANQDPKLNQG
ncbi:MAG: hypothetical protein RLZZ399_112 [Verrucomicrobiota bacterium]|jgi:voltage-gated potassium channel